MNIAKKEQTPINLTQLTKAEILSLSTQKHPYTCPDCQQAVILKVGTKKRPHFAHKVKCDGVCHALESETHQQVKQLFYTWALNQHAQYVNTEVRLPQINRIADVYFELNGRAYVFEIQKSLISESELKARTADYKKQNIQVFWIIIGQQKNKKMTQVLNPLLAKNKEERLFYFEMDAKRLFIYEQVYFITPKEVLKQQNQIVLEDLTLAQLLNKQVEVPLISRQTWLDIKKEFRMRRWAYEIKSDRVLRRLCYEQQLSLSLVPAEVGWPIVNNVGMEKPLFVWQTYVLVGIVMRYEIGECFSLSDVVKGLQYRYRLYMKASMMKQVYQEVSIYLTYLVQFNVIKKVGSYYEYVRRPNTYHTLDLAFEHDARLSQCIKKTLR
ncbi:MAG TPA: competence protein CoiA [Firmicutes bacterium]|nr:competence protein CoiA [Bacillota bacterium]